MFNDTTGKTPLLSDSSSAVGLAAFYQLSHTFVLILLVALEA